MGLCVGGVVGGGCFGLWPVSLVGRVVSVSLGVSCVSVSSFGGVLGVVVVVEADRAGDGELVRAEPAPCVLCGGLTPLRAGGRPQHLGGVCVSFSSSAPGAASRGSAQTAADRTPRVSGQAESGSASGGAGGAVSGVSGGSASGGVLGGSGSSGGSRESASSFVARRVREALEDNDGDVAAATAALVRRAVPDAMELLHSTRVGSRYDFTHYVNVDDVPVLKKPSRDGADLVWEGRPRWRNRLVETGPRRTVTVLDVNGAYLSALKTHLPIGAPRYSASGEFDRKRSGVYLVDPPEWGHPDLPNPLGNRLEPGPLWITGATLRLLLRVSDKFGLCAPPRILESWTSGSSEGLLERFRRELAAARDVAVETGDTVTLEYVKAMYSKFVSTMGESSANREMRRPDWMHIIRSQAFANLWLKAWKARQAGLTLVRMMGTDELHVIGDWRAVFREGRRLTDMKVKDEYVIGSGD